MASNLLTYEIQDDVAVIGLNRPAKRNAISDEFVEAIATVVQRAQKEAAVAVLFGHGDHFSAGLDLTELSGKTQFERMLGSQCWHRAFDAIDHGTIPFVSALNGAVLGGGLELASSTHIRVADATAFFALPEGQRGIYVGGGGSVRIARLMSVAKMTDMMLTGRVLHAEEAERVNLVQYVVPAGESLQFAKKIARQIATNAPLSNYAVINVLTRVLGMSQGDGLFVESLAAALASSSHEAETRLSAFLAKKTNRIGMTNQSHTD